MKIRLWDSTVHPVRFGFNRLFAFKTVCFIYLKGRVRGRTEKKIFLLVHPTNGHSGMQLPGELPHLAEAQALGSSVSFPGALAGS